MSLIYLLNHIFTISPFLSFSEQPEWPQEHHRVRGLEHHAHRQRGVRGAAPYALLQSQHAGHDECEVRI